MRTKILGETRLVDLLTANAENTGESLSIRAELTVAYDEFTDRLVRLIEDENSIADMRTAFTTFGQNFMPCNRNPATRRKKNAPCCQCLVKSLELVESEIELIKLIFPSSIRPNVATESVAAPDPVGTVPSGVAGTGYRFARL